MRSTSRSAIILSGVAAGLLLSWFAGSVMSRGRPSPVAAATGPAHDLVIGGVEDRSTPPGESRAMAAAVPGEHELWLVPHGDHAQISALADKPYRTRVSAFLRRSIGSPD